MLRYELIIICENSANHQKIREIFLNCKKEHNGDFFEDFYVEEKDSYVTYYIGLEPSCCESNILVVLMAFHSGLVTLHRNKDIKLIGADLTRKSYEESSFLSEKDLDTQ